MPQPVSDFARLVVPDSRAYPDIGHAALMTVAVFMLQAGLGVVFLLGSHLAWVTGITESAMTMPPLVLAAINVVALGVVVFWGYLANRVSLRVLLPMVPLPLAAATGVLIATTGLAFVLSEFVHWLQIAVPVPQRVADFFSGPVLNEEPWSVASLLIIVAPVTEETLFRGVILRGLLHRHRPAVAIALSALLFALVHVNPWQFVPASVLGLVLGWWYERTRSLIPCILGHASYNAVVFVLASRTLGAPDPLLAGADDFTAGGPWWLTLAGAALIALGLWLVACTTEGMQRERLAGTAIPPPLPPPLPRSGS